MEKIVKEVEIAGVKHSITLADDMVGQGLVKDENGVVSIKTPKVISGSSSFITGIVAHSDYGLCLHGHTIAQALSGSGLDVTGGRLSISANSITNNNAFMSGLISGISRNLTGLVDSGLYITDYKITVALNTGSGLGFVSYDPNLDAVCMGIKIASRTRGMRLFFNDKGELDVIYD